MEFPQELPWLTTGVLDSISEIEPGTIRPKLHSTFVDESEPGQPATQDELVTGNFHTKRQSPEFAMIRTVNSIDWLSQVIGKEFIYSTVEVWVVLAPAWLQFESKLPVAPEEL